MSLLKWDIDKYIEEYSGYYTGEECIINISYGELENDANYIPEHLKEEFVINEEYGYYDMTSSGLYINFKKLLDNVYNQGKKIIISDYEKFNNLNTIEYNKVYNYGYTNTYEYNKDLEQFLKDNSIDYTIEQTIE